MATSSIQKWGNSQGVRIPKSVLQAARLQNGDDVEIIADGEQITIRRANRIESLDALFAGYSGTCQPQEVDTGAPVGREVW